MRGLPVLAAAAAWAASSLSTSADALEGRSVVFSRVGDGEQAEDGSDSGLFRLDVGETRVLGGGVGVCIMNRRVATLWACGGAGEEIPRILIVE